MRVSYIIPTLLRTKELERLLDSFIGQTDMPDEIIVVAQGEEAKIYTLPETYSDLPIEYITVDFCSLTRARNLGVSRATGELIGFLDDDLVLSANYNEQVKQFFDGHSKALGVQGVIQNFEQGHTEKVGGNKLVYKIYNMLAKLFLLNNSSTKNKLLLSGRNQYASRVNQIQSCEWLSGIGIYRRHIFSEFSFDEKLEGYALGEDKLFSYPIGQQYERSLFVDPAITCEHHYGEAGRPKKREWVVMKVQYTYYLWYQLLRKKGLHTYVAFWWANIGDIIVVTMAVLMKQQTPAFLFWHIREYLTIVWNKPILLRD